jgi:hypothetical protein
MRINEPMLRVTGKDSLFMLLTLKLCELSQLGKCHIVYTRIYIWLLMVYDVFLPIRSKTAGQGVDAE